MRKHCQQCDREFHNPSSLKRHVIAKHTPIRHEHQCSSCDVKFARKDALQRHISSKHKRDSMERCQFCLGHFRKDYSAQHEPRCARKYWAKFCRNASLTNGIRDDQSNEINRRPLVLRDISPDAEPIPAVGNGLRVVHEIDIDTRLASRAFKLMFQHFWEKGDDDSCLEAIAIAFCHGVPIFPPDLKESDKLPLPDPFQDVFWLVLNVGRHVRGGMNIIDPDTRQYTLMDSACSSGAASLLEPLFWRGAEFGDDSLLYGIESGSFDTVHFCLALGADPDGFAMRASANPETTHIASLLVEYGATVFVRNALGNTPLHLTARRADVDLLRVLLAKDSSSEFLDSTDEEGKRALEVAIESIDSGTTEDQVLDFVAALLDAGADANGFDYQHSALSYAVEHRCEAVIRLVLDRTSESPRKLEYLNEALMEMIEYGDESIGILIEAGANVDDKPYLKSAIRYGSLETLELLLKAGARVVVPFGDDTLKHLFKEARERQLSGRESIGWFDDAMAKCELLCLYFPDDERLRDLC
jgi:hypothetical protein